MLRENVPGVIRPHSREKNVTSAASKRYAQANRQRIVDYLRDGSKGDDLGRFGFELEHVLVHDNGMPVRYSEEGGTAELLERISSHYDQKAYEDGNLIGLALSSGETVTTEPAAQIELSAGPFEHVGEAKESYERWRSWLDPELRALGIQTPFLGYTPAARALELELIPKFRYDCMNRYLGDISEYGPQMMRGSSSLQISVDYRDEADAVRKFRISNALAPALALICDNSPIYQRHPHPYHIVRTRIWQGVDPARCNTVPGGVSRDFTFERYADWVMGMPAILAPDPKEPGKYFYAGEKTFDQIYSDRVMTDEELLHAISMQWPDTRIKHYLEIRPADAMPPEYCYSYAALICGIFYSDAAIDAIDGMLPEINEEAVTASKQDIMTRGYEASLYGRGVGEWADALFELAEAGLDEEDVPYLEPLRDLSARRTTLAEEYLREHELDQS